MHPTIAPPEQRVLLENISWETYNRLLDERGHSPGTRITYDDGWLEIMAVSFGHEMPNRVLASLVDVIAVETARTCLPAGGTTFKREDLKKGFEPDTSYYLEHESLVRGKVELDLETDPPPDLVIEVDITRSSLDRFPIFAAVGVPEVWRFDGEKVTMYALEGSRYAQIAFSVSLPPLTAEQATIFLGERNQMTNLEWDRRVRQWVRANR